MHGRQHAPAGRASGVAQGHHFVHGPLRQAEAEARLLHGEGAVPRDAAGRRLRSGPGCGLGPGGALQVEGQGAGVAAGVAHFEAHAVGAARHRGEPSLGGLVPVKLQVVARHAVAAVVLHVVLAEQGVVHVRVALPLPVPVHMVQMAAEEGHAVHPDPDAAHPAFVAAAVVEVLGMQGEADGSISLGRVPGTQPVAPVAALGGKAHRPAGVGRGAGTVAQRVEAHAADGGGLVVGHLHAQALRVQRGLVAVAPQLEVQVGTARAPRVPAQGDQLPALHGQASPVGVLVQVEAPGLVLGIQGVGGDVALELRQVPVHRGVAVAVVDVQGLAIAPGAHLDPAHPAVGHRPHRQPFAPLGLDVQPAVEVVVPGLHEVARKHQGNVQRGTEVRHGGLPGARSVGVR